MPKIAIIGTTSWGITLGIVLGRKGLQVSLWARTEQEAAGLTNNGPNSALLTGTTFPRQLSVTSSLSESLAGAKAVVLVVPSQSVRQNIKLVAEHLNGSMLIVSAAKGLEIGSGKRMSEVIVDEIQPELQPNICVLSGPNLAQEILNDQLITLQV
ncbi:2-dehydropantoate 2-reductase N-terminal domain-containing protein, partial [Chloroflexota bacterium]